LELSALAKTPFQNLIITTEHTFLIAEMHLDFLQMAVINLKNYRLFLIVAQE
jgi:hypothetical protein